MLDPRKITASPNLPTLPVVAIKLLELSKNPDCEVKDLVALIKTDPAICAKILKAVNSTVFGFSSKVSSIDRAVPLLGTTGVTSLALSFSLVQGAMSSGAMAQFYSAYWLQSVVQATATDKLGRLTPSGLGCELFLTGLLIDIGRLAMLKTIPGEYAAVLKTAEESQRNLHDIEIEQLGFSHVQIGCDLMRQWGLPEPLIHACLLHHATREEIAAVSDTADYALVQAAALGSSVGDYFGGTNQGLALARLRELTAAFYGFDEVRLETFLIEMKGHIDEAAAMFSVNTSDLGDPADLMARANDQLAQMAVREHVASTQAICRQKLVEEENRELESLNEQLQQQVMHDPLTRIFNRSFFDQALEKEVQRCRRSAQPLGILFIDVDRFKSLNDTYGHQFGDLVLKRVAAQLGDVVRGADTVARYGGEEFVVLVNQPTESGIQRLAERIRARVETLEISNDAESVRVTVSVGAALTIPRRDDAQVGAELIAAADQAMYEAKHGGRNQTRFKPLGEEHELKLVNLATQRRFSRWLVSLGVLEMTAVANALAEYAGDHVQIGQLAIRHGVLTAEQVSLVLGEQQQGAKRFGETAVGLEYLDEQQLIALLALQKEDPRALAAVLIRHGALDVAAGRDLMNRYMAECGVRGEKSRLQSALA